MDKQWVAGLLGAAGRAKNRQVDSNGGVDFSLDDTLLMFERQKELLANLLPVAPNDTERRNVKKRLEDISMRLVRNHIIVSTRVEMMELMSTQDAEKKMKEQLNSMKTDEEFYEELDSFTEKYKVAESEFTDSLDLATVTSHDLYVNHIAELNKIYADFEARVKTGSRGRSVPPPSGSIVSVAGEGMDFIPATDPVTKGMLVDPVRNQKCDHIYGKKSILQLIAQNRQKCPYPGCSNRDFIKRIDLVEDPELTRKVAAKVAEAQKRTDNQSSQQRLRNSVHLDDTT